MDLVSSLQPIITIAKDFFGIISSIALVVLAILGLRTWERQLKGTTQYELAKKILKTTYRLRNAIDSVRNPLIMGGEYSEALKAINLQIEKNDPKYHEKITYAVYQYRWKPVADTFTELELESMEAEAIWGKDARDTIMRVRESVASLLSAITIYFDMVYSPSKKDPVAIESFRNIIYKTSENDDFSKKIEQRINTIENYLRSYLKT